MAAPTNKKCRAGSLDLLPTTIASVCGRVDVSEGVGHKGVSVELLPPLPLRRLRTGLTQFGLRRINKYSRDRLGPIRQTNVPN